jgi:hypothetical protein
MLDRIPWGWWTPLIGRPVCLVLGHAWGARLVGDTFFLDDDYSTPGARWCSRCLYAEGGRLPAPFAKRS